MPADGILTSTTIVTSSGAEGAVTGGVGSFANVHGHLLPKAAGAPLGRPCRSAARRPRQDETGAEMEWRFEHSAKSAASKDAVWSRYVDVPNWRD